MGSAADWNTVSQLTCCVIWLASSFDVIDFRFATPVARSGMSASSCRYVHSSRHTPDTCMHAPSGKQDPECSHCRFQQKKTHSYKRDLPVCSHGSCCWQEKELWFGSPSVKMVWHCLDNTMEGNRRYLDLEGKLHGKEGNCWSHTDDICFNPKLSGLNVGLWKDEEVNTKGATNTPVFLRLSDKLNALLFTDTSGQCVCEREQRKERITALHGARR